MTGVITFTVTFHEPFAVSSGNSDDGLDVTVDSANPLPGSVMKGLLRAHARDWLGMGPAQVDSIFGSRTQQSPWVFNDVLLTAKVSLWNRVEVDPDGRSQERSLVVGQQNWADCGTFSCEWLGGGQAPAAHVLILRAAARDVVSLGTNRRRGLGWVSIEDETPWTAAHTQELLALVDAVTTSKSEPTS